MIATGIAITHRGVMKPRILIVEDEPAITDTIKFALETDGFETVVLECGLPVIPLLALESIDLIVLDINLPDITGIELCKEIRKTSDTPIIFLTARAEEIDRVVGLEIGGDDYLTKPFSPRELSARVKAVLRRTHQNVASTPIIPFRIDESRRKIFYYGRDLDFSEYEYRILKILIHRPGQVYSREKLMDMAWDEPDTAMDRTVDAHIKNIRAKLKAVRPDMDPIVTRRGAGYALKDGL